MGKQHKIIIDTDIGDDIDDAFALAFAAGSDELDLLGVGVVYGDVHTRARLARKLLRASGRPEIPIAVGYERPLGYDYLKGTQPAECSQLAAVAGETEPLDQSRSAQQLILDAARKFPGEVTVITIGAMTNIGAALCQEPALAKQLAGIISLTGGNPPGKDTFCWNGAYDALSVQIIAHSGVPLTLVGGSTAGAIGLARRELDALAVLAARDDAFACVLSEMIVLYDRNKRGNKNAHTLADVHTAWTCDVAAVAALLIPEQMDLRPGRFSFTLSGNYTFELDPAGPHRMAHAKISAAYRNEAMRRIFQGKWPAGKI